MSLVIQKKGIFADHRGRTADEVVESVRSQLARLRGQLFDLGQEFAGFRDQLSVDEGGLTLVIADLHGIASDMKRCRPTPEPAPAAPETERKETDDA